MTTRAKPIGLALGAILLAFVIALWLGTRPAARAALTNVGGAGNECTCSHRIEP